MGTRILAAAVKVAVNTAAMKQVAAAGYSTKGSCTSWSGRTAYVSWEVSNRWNYDHARRELRRFRINYPGMPDDALLTRKEADLIAAYTLHETGHVLYTNNVDVRHLDLEFSHRQLATLANGIEDARMEDSVIRLGARNARGLFSQLLSKLTGDISKDYNPCQLPHAPFTLALLCREALGNGNQYTSALLARIPEPHRSLYASAMEWMKTAPSGYDDNCWSMLKADQFMGLWQQMRQAQGLDDPKPDAQQPEVGNSRVGEDEEDGDEIDYEEGEDSEFNPSDEDGDDEPNSPQPDDGSDFDDAPDFPERPKDEGDSADDGDMGGGVPNPDGEDSDDDEGEDGDDKEPSDTSTPFDDPGNDEGNTINPEPSIDDLVKRINKRTESDIDIRTSAFSPASRDEDVMDYLLQRHKGQLL